MHPQQSMMIFKIIGQIEQLVTNSPQPRMGGANKRIVQIDEILDLLGDLKATIPEDIRRANSIAVEAESMIESAQEQADEIIHNARLQEYEILQQAQMQAEKIHADAEAAFEARVYSEDVHKQAVVWAEQLTTEARNNAQTIYNASKQYADDVLSDLQRYLMEYHSLVQQNREELNITADTRRQTASTQDANVKRGAYEPDEQEEEYWDDEEEQTAGPLKQFFSRLGRKAKEESEEYDVDVEE